LAGGKPSSSVEGLGLPLPIAIKFSPFVEWIYPAIRRKAGFIRTVRQAAPAPKSFNGSGSDGRFIFRIRDRVKYSLG